MKTALLWLSEAIVLAGVWLLLAGSTERVEIFFAAGAGIVGATASQIVWHQQLAQFYGHPAWIAQAWHLATLEVQGTWVILGVLARQLLGRPAPSILTAVPFDAGGDDDASATRRALATTLTTMTPNSIVVGIEEERGLLLYHQLRRQPVSAMLKNLGAKG